MLLICCAVFSKGGSRLWASNAAISGGSPYTLRVQDDGNVMIRNSAGVMTWQTNTAGL
jgi:hypothetical protein